jgi:predicted lipid carrier protein YhbT
MRSEMSAPEPGPVRDPGTSGWQRLLGLLPPPQRIGMLLRLLPAPPLQQLLEVALGSALEGMLAEGELAFLEGRRLAVEVDDLGIGWVVTLQAGRIRVAGRAQQGEARICAGATDLLLLAARMADADTLFFQRRLRLTGDTELGLAARNLLDRLPWGSLPLPLRILLVRAARLAASARAARAGDD